jgi:hypothetical protein
MYGQWPADSTSRIAVCEAPGQQQFPRLVSDGSGGAIVVWEDGRTGSTRIYAQRIDSAGVVQWATDGVVICTADGAERPRLVSDGAGGAIITWWDMRAGWPIGSVCAQRVDGSGATKWAQNGVVLDSVANSVAFPVIAAYDSGAVIAWHGVDGEPWIQKIDTAGGIQWAPGGVQVALNGDNPMSIIGDGEGGVILAWSTYDIGYIDKEVFARHIDQVGNVTTTINGDTICDAPEGQVFPQCVPDGHGGAIIGWNDARDPDHYPYAQRYTPDVSMEWITLWPAGGVRSADSIACDGATAIFASDGHYGAYVSWNGPLSSDVFAQRIDSMGTPQWSGDHRLAANTYGGVGDLVPDGAGGVFVVLLPNYSTIKVQRLSSLGVHAFAGEGLTLTYGIQYLGNLEGVSDGEGSLIVAWAEQPMFDFNIYMSRAVAPDFPTTTGSLISAHTPAGFRLGPVAPNPVQGNATVTYGMDAPGRVTLELFDAHGIKVATLADRWEQRGQVKLQLNTEGLASGLYMIRMVVDGSAACQRFVVH